MVYYSSKVNVKLNSELQNNTLSGLLFKDIFPLKQPDFSSMSSKYIGRGFHYTCPFLIKLYSTPATLWLHISCKTLV